MIHGKKKSVARQNEVPRQPETLTTLSDKQLLGRFRGVWEETRESAFRELVERHGPMVRGVCRQVLRHPHDVEDAFQATFLVLVLKAHSIRAAESLAPWLHSVAYRTARRARAVLVAVPPRRSGMSWTSSRLDQEDAHHVEIRRLLQEELGRLPDKYRVPIVLCHLEGKTHQQAARLLRWPVGTVSGRLSRGRELLRARLERRGFAVNSAVVLIPWLDLVQSVPISSIESALSAVSQFAAAQTVSASVLSLTHGVLKTMFLNRLKTISAAVILMAIVSGGVWAHMPSHAAATDLASECARFDVHERSSGGIRRNLESSAADSRLSRPPIALWRGLKTLRPDCPIAMAANAVEPNRGLFPRRRIGVFQVTQTSSQAFKLLRSPITTSEQAQACSEVVYFDGAYHVGLFF